MLTLGRRPIGAIVIAAGLLFSAVGSSPPASAATATSIVAQRGDHSATVTAIQRALVAAGIPVAGGVDGWYGAGTTAAVTRFQQLRGLPATGAVDTATATLLGVLPATPILRVGSRGPAVADLQRKLSAIGITVRGGADGIYGAYTAAAVKYFQQSRHIAPSGNLDVGTSAVLDAAQPVAATTPTPPTTPAPAPAPVPAPAPATTGVGPGSRGPVVVGVQQSLIAVGLRPNGGADGIYGASTAAMVRAFQTRTGLPATGSADNTTIATLLAAAAATVPAPTTPPSAPPTGPAANGAVPAVPGDHGLVDLEYLPLPRTCAIRGSFGAPRSGGRTHMGMDISAARGTPIYAVRAGTITKRTFDYPGSLGGNALYLTTADGTYFFHAHLDRFAAGIAPGVKVPAGAVIGYVGSTGNAGGPHLHLEVHPRGGAAIDPYPIVKAASGC